MEFISRLPSSQGTTLKENLESLESVYPFNEYEYILSNLLGMDSIELRDYLEIREDYTNRNEYLHIFEKYGSPTSFGITWAQSYVHSISPELKKPSKKTKPSFDNEYDFFYPLPNGDEIRIEVKASRAVDARSSEPLYVKALSSMSKLPFDMNFQQIKPKCCDVFVWVAVWRDAIKCWILSSKEVENNKFYSKGQHRGNTDEGQLHINHTNVAEFEKYEAKPSELLAKIMEAFNRQQTIH